MLSILTDVKNFVYGSISEGFERAGRWGHWAFGWRGESFNHAVRSSEGPSWSGFRFGGLIWPSIAVGILVNPVAGLGMWLLGTAAVAGLGLATGLLTGGFAEVARGWEIRAQKHEMREQEKSVKQMKNNNKYGSRTSFQAADMEAAMSDRSFVEQLQQEQEQERSR